MGLLESMTSRKNSLILLVFIGLATVFLVLQFAGMRRPSKTSSSVPVPFYLSSGIDWRAVDPEQMSPQQIMDYFEWSNRTSCRLTHDFGGHMLKNPSGLDGQKAVCLNPVQLAPPAGDCLVYSFGINNEWSFDEAMEKYGCEIYAFDPSMKAEDHDHTPAIHFFKLGLNSRDTISERGWNFRSLSSIYNMLKERHGDRVIDYLKMDIEYDEWIAIPQIIESGMMDKIRQLAVEIHLPIEDSIGRMRNRVSIIKSIEESGMVRFDSKFNPWYKGEFKLLGLSGSRGYEIAWYNSKFLFTKGS